MSYRRRSHEPPQAIAEEGWRYHHLGIPNNTPRDGEYYIERWKMYVCGFETSPYGIEWMRFEADSPVDELIKKVPHLAFEVDDLKAAIQGREVLGEITSPSTGVRVAMIVHDGAPVELIEFQSG